MEAEVGPVWDLWSLGVVILEVLIGPDVVEMMENDQKIRAVLANVRQMIPGDLITLVERMTIYVSVADSKSLMKKDNVITQENISNFITKFEEKKQFDLLNGPQLLMLIKYKAWGDNK